MFVWGAAQRGIPPQINVIGTVMFLLGAGAGAGRRARQPAPGPGPGVRLQADGGSEGRGTDRPRGAEPTVFWLDDPARPEPLPPLTGARPRRPGRGRRRLLRALDRAAAKRARPRPRRRAARGRTRAATRPAAATAASASASLTHGFGNGMRAGPTRSPSWTARAGRTSRRSAHRRASTASTATGSATGELTVATAPHQVEALAARWRYAARPGTTSHCSTRTRYARRGRLADVPRRRARRPGTAIVEPARLAWGLRQACLDAGVRIHEGTARSPRCERGRHADRAHRRRLRGRRPRRAGHQRVPAAAAPAAADDRAGLRLRADDRAADAAQLAAIGWRPARGVGDAATSSTTTGSPATTGSCGAATTRSTTTAAGSPASSSSAT